MDCVAWSPDNKFVVSGSLDTNIIIWYMDDPHKHVIVKGRMVFRDVICKSSYGHYFLGASRQRFSSG